MSLFGVIGNVFLQLMLACMLIMLAIFGGGGIVNGNKLSSKQILFLNSSIYLMPILCLLTCGIFIWAYNTNGNTSFYWAHMLPISYVVLYFLTIQHFSK